MIGSPIPNASLAEVPPAKLRDYALNPNHPDGVHKARVFLSALGIARAGWEYLAEQLLSGVLVSPVVGEKRDRHGTRYEVAIDVLGRNGRTLAVTTAWFAVDDAAAPRLISAYVAVANR